MLSDVDIRSSAATGNLWTQRHPSPGRIILWTIGRPRLEVRFSSWIWHDYLCQNSAPMQVCSCPLTLSFFLLTVHLSLPWSSPERVASVGYQLSTILLFLSRSFPDALKMSVSAPKTLGCAGKCLLFDLPVQPLHTSGAPD